MKKVTIYDIAEKLQVSPATVTRALNNMPKVGEEKRRLIQKTAEEMGYIANRAATLLSRKEVKIDVIIYGSIREFYHDIEEGIDAAYESLRDFNLKINKYVFDKSEYDDAFICEEIRKAGNRGIDGLIIYSVSDTEEIALAIDELFRSGVQVMIVNSDITTIYPHYIVRSDGEMAGRMAAELLDWVVAGGNVCFFKGERNTGVLRHNNFGFEKEVAQRRLNIVGNFYDDGSAEKAMRFFKAFQATGMEIGGIYINSAVSGGICDEMYKCGDLEQYKVVASDVSSGIVKYMREGLVLATIFQNPYKQGHDACERLFKIIAEKETIERVKLISPIILCRSNIEYYSKFISE